MDLITLPQVTERLYARKLPRLPMRLATSIAGATTEADLSQGADKFLDSFELLSGAGSP